MSRLTRAQGKSRRFSLEKRSDPRTLGFRMSRLRIAIAQFNAHVGDLEGNADRILEFAIRARDDGADVMLTPELALCGYPPEDLLMRSDFYRACARQLEKLALAGLPRARGDRPDLWPARWVIAPSPPRTRGSTSRCRAGQRPGWVSPAHAGIDPISRPHCKSPGRLPRARGDRPAGWDNEMLSLESPPRTRGSTWYTACDAGNERVSPAHAGIDPVPQGLHPASLGLPRARGDRPVA